MAQGIPSVGQSLHEKGIRQGTYFLATIFNADLRNKLTDSRVFDKYRKSEKLSRKINDHDLLIVLSQDCDISCKDDLDPLIELGVFKPIDATTVTENNSYAKSVRKLNLIVNDKYYCGDVHHIVWCIKSDLYDALVKNNFSDVRYLDTKLKKTCAIWRSNRYIRLALPNEFTKKFSQAFDTLLKKQYLAVTEVDELYIRLDAYDEREKYQFEILALLDIDVNNEKLETSMSLMEDLSDLLIKSGNKEFDDNRYCVKKDEISVHDLSQFRKMSLEYISLSAADES